VRRNYTRGYWSTPKSRSGERAIPLSGRVEDELRIHLGHSRFCGEDDLVFANPLSGEVLPHGPLVRRLKKALKAAGVRTIRFHDLRHTFGTRIAAGGVPMRVLQEWMGPPSSMPTTNPETKRVASWMLPSPLDLRRRKSGLALVSSSACHG
jgi:integrase